MKEIADLLFEARMLKEIERSGFSFLGTGKESVAEHSFMITFIAYVLSEMEPAADARKLISMCLVHDLPETRIGDLNYVQKQYVTADENKAVADATRHVPFGPALAELIAEFSRGETLEARLAKDADQLALVLELKALADGGSDAPDKWMPFVLKRLKTATAKKLAESILAAERDNWWMKTYDE